MRPADELRDAVEAYLALALLRAGARSTRRRRSATRSSRAASASVPFSASRWPRRTARRSRRRYPLPPRSSWSTRSRSSTTTCRRWTTTTSAEDVPALTSRSVKASRCSPATRSSQRRCDSRSATSPTEVARDLVEATLGMIGGQYRDITGDDADLEELHRLKTGSPVRRVRSARTRCGGGRRRMRELRGSRSATTSASSSRSSTTSSTTTAMRSASGARARAGSPIEVADRARARLDAIDADTSVLGELVDALAVRTG